MTEEIFLQRRLDKIKEAVEKVHLGLGMIHLFAVGLWDIIGAQGILACSVYVISMCQKRRWNCYSISFSFRYNKAIPSKKLWQKFFSLPGPFFPQILTWLSTFLSLLKTHLLNSKAFSATKSSMVITFKMVGKTESHTKPKTYQMQICSLTTSTDDSHAHWNLRSPDFIVSEGNLYWFSASLYLYLI